MVLASFLILELRLVEVLVIVNMNFTNSECAFNSEDEASVVAQ